MIDRSPEPDFELPPELAALDAELSGIRIEERASFGPELEAELRRASARSQIPSALTSARRQLAIAASIALLLGAVAVPPARASLVALIGQLEAVLPSVAVAVAPQPAPPPDDIVVELPQEQQQFVRTASEVGKPEAADPFRPIRIVPPRLVDVEAVRGAIDRFYPRRLQEDGVGGIVNVLVYIDSLGSAHQPQVNESSGLADLDQAALSAASALGFRPATRDGRAFGMWVRFDLV